VVKLNSEVVQNQVNKVKEIEDLMQDAQRTLDALADTEATQSFDGTYTCSATDVVSVSSRSAEVAAIGRMIHGEILSVVTFLSTAVVVIESAVTAVALLVTSFCSFINDMFTSPFKALNALVRKNVTESVMNATENKLLEFEQQMEAELVEVITNAQGVRTVFQASLGQIEIEVEQNKIEQFVDEPQWTITIIKGGGTTRWTLARLWRKIRTSCERTCCMAHLKPTTGIRNLSSSAQFTQLPAEPRSVDHYRKMGRGGGHATNWAYSAADIGLAVSYTPHVGDVFCVQRVVITAMLEWLKKF
jgi:hypothetical protein